MKSLIVLFGGILGALAQGQGSAYSCTGSRLNVQFIFTLTSSEHAAWSRNCTLKQCNVRNESTSNCRRARTPCFDYRTFNGTQYCAPGIVCSALRSCDRAGNACSSNTSICVVNSCCSSAAVCLPLFLTQLCEPALYSKPFLNDVLYDAIRQEIKMNISYHGGCKQHAFELQIGSCNTVPPILCNARVVDYTVDDPCSDLIPYLFSVNIRTVGLDKAPYRGATIAIESANYTFMSVLISSYGY